MGASATWRKTAKSETTHMLAVPRHFLFSVFLCPVGPSRAGPSAFLRVQRIMRGSHVFHGLIYAAADAADAAADVADAAADVADAAADAADAAADAADAVAD